MASAAAMLLFGIIGGSQAVASDPAPPAGASRTAPSVDMPLVNIDAPGILDHDSSVWCLDLRPFGGDEKNTYANVGFRSGVGNGGEIGIRGAFASRRTWELTDVEGTGIRHGGSDVELFARFAPPDWGNRTTVQVGVARPDTPARNRWAFTVGAVRSFDLAGSGATAVYFNPRAALISGDSLVGLGLGVRERFSSRGPALVADYTPLIAGENTRDVHTGARRRKDVYGVALRLPMAAASRGDRSVEIGYTNAIGATTGFSLTPGLGGSGAFYLSIATRR